ncbi:MAG: HD domain-containing phosphohydrolase [Armatimonadota bacterium]|nr:HD domain-containing phosphohydrolase [Armatimonadota bacterium]MDR7456892.1 HD domain-containing phosphohydrolase [Armatimonadota bacterium]MDR7495623.1 HD domain-containing phosphohydrolase [Armatimonadota bacterium]
MQTITGEVRLLVLAVTAVATIGIVAFSDQIRWQEWQQLVLFFCLIALASSVRIADPRGRTITPSTVLTYLAMYVFNAPTVLLLVAVGRAVGYSLDRGWVPWRSIFNGAQVGLSASAGAYVFGLVSQGAGPIPEARVYAAALIAPLLHQTLNNLFVAIGVSRWRGTPFVNTWYAGVQALFWPNLLSIPTAFVLAILYVRVHHAVTLAYLALLPFQWMALRLYVRRRELYAQIVDGLVVAADANFPLGKGHARRVAELAVAVAREMRLGEAVIESVQFAAQLHDVGMIGKDDLLDRPVLTAEEVRSLEDHVKVGAEIARELPRREIAEAILYHHERFDGTGYPGGLRGEEIPLGARIIALCEAVDSMRSGMFPFGAAMPWGAIVSLVQAEAGRAFDPGVVDAFLRAVAAGTVHARRREPSSEAFSSTATLGGIPVP